ncbi:MAG: DNA-binding response regulator [Deltaproteobacteria bacterium]|nr:response regulator transcription factor [Deltaproteobacteria bacterium]RLA90509.1 MAG: DNA-binding response regulator [Deltaproteobacteria bacterium]
MKILLVEDDIDTKKFLKKGLEENYYSVETTSSGLEALEYIESQPFDLIILDIMLPELDGISLLKNIRKRGNFIPVILLTVKDSNEEIIAGLDAGADDYITKPFSFNQLLARIRAVTRRGKQYTPSLLKVADLFLDQISRRVYKGDKEIVLTPKEFSLLEYLLLNKGRIVTRTMILEKVWNLDYDGFSNVVDVHINHLRKKIEKDSSFKFIHTVKGVGYILEAKHKNS